VRAVDVSTVVDAQDTDDLGIVVDSVNDPVRTPSGCPESGELALQRMTH